MPCQLRPCCYVFSRSSAQFNMMVVCRACEQDNYRFQPEGFVVLSFRLCALSSCSSIGPVSMYAVRQLSSPAERLLKSSVGPRSQPWVWLWLLPRRPCSRQRCSEYLATNSPNIDSAPNQLRYRHCCLLRT